MFHCPNPKCKNSIADRFLIAQFIREVDNGKIREHLLEKTATKEGGVATDALTFETASAIAISMEDTKKRNAAIEHPLKSRQGEQDW